MKRVNISSGKSNRCSLSFDPRGPRSTTARGARSARTFSSFSAIRAMSSRLCAAFMDI